MIFKCKVCGDEFTEHDKSCQCGLCTVSKSYTSWLDEPDHKGKHKSTNILGDFTFVNVDLTKIEYHAVGIPVPGVIDRFWEKWKQMKPSVFATMEGADDSLNLNGNDNMEDGADV
jgi:hypothetical protein